MREKGALLALLAGCGLTLTLYTLYVELQHERNRNYKALCDINEHMSCTKAFTSRYGKGFGLFDTQSHFNIPNPVYG
ncbi:vitamin K epoxide reductase complex subunit 1-like protein [Dinothrombium tinctorium]|uniref:vitamin-K-epoxide reductase (warfarin-sensitive) n=1 Tax=Dinothrombium tinctorium TaxID=1965070 RepID=A0A443QAZ7_9ACAR|nr:vitamin K epoxide reductase complex subunit 1-like protein [Dinothrombium tinctorium]